ncbi:MAG: hypothetical protein OXN22_08370 [Deltaproteobacteria bacterium]|nr:hypothetical protein [Deltaproteobacteria bacterium]
MSILSHVRISFLSLALLLHLLGGEGLRRLLRGWRRRKPAVRTLAIAGGNRHMVADLYAVQDARPRAGLLVTHGVLDTGKDDPRLVALADELASCGFAVLVPELEGLKSLRLEMAESEDIAAAFRFMLSREEVDATRAGLLGISFAAGPTLKAAADPSIRDRVKFVVSFGGYYDTVNIIRYLTTGRDEYRGHRHVEPPEIYARYVFVKNLLVHVTVEEDRRVLSGLLDDMQREADAGVTRWDGEAPVISPERLTEDGRAVYDLIRNQDPARVRSLVEATEPGVRHYLEGLSLPPVVPQVTARVLIGHGDTDPLIPSTESLRLADALPDPSRVYVAVLKVVSHVDARLSVQSIREFLTATLPSCCRFYGLIFRILKQQLDL